MQLRLELLRLFALLPGEPCSQAGNGQADRPPALLSNLHRFSRCFLTTNSTGFTRCFSLRWDGRETLAPRLGVLAYEGLNINGRGQRSGGGAFCCLVAFRRNTSPPSLGSNTRPAAMAELCASLGQRKQ